MMYKHKNKRIKYISNEVKHVWKYFASRIRKNLIKMDIYPSWCENKRRHNIEKHEERRKEYTEDLSCKRCYNIRKEDEHWIFQKFWKIFAKITFDDIRQNAYNMKTMQGFMNLLTLRRGDEENEETGGIKQHMYMIL